MIRESAESFGAIKRRIATVNCEEAFSALHGAARGPSAEWKDLFFAYPAFTPQRASAPRRHAGLLSVVPRCGTGVSRV
jgi:hypothetical protein